MVTRRQTVVALGAGALTPFAGLAQQRSKKLWRIGFLIESAPQSSFEDSEFRVGMKALGYSMGTDYVIEARSARSDVARLPALAAELLEIKVDVIVTGGTPSTMAASNATRDIPIVFLNVGDPVGSGFAASLARPSRNITGLTGLGPELYAKRLDMLRQILPTLRRVGFLYNPTNSADLRSLTRLAAESQELRLEFLPAPVHEFNMMSAAFAKLANQRAQALIVSGSSADRGDMGVVTHAATYRLPAMFSDSAYVEAGGLASYSPDNEDKERRGAAYVARILKGAKPGDMPIEQPTKFNLVINKNTANVLGITIPTSVLLRADRVIE